MHAPNRQLTRQEVQKLAKDLPRLCLQGPVPTHTVMSMALEITTLLAERDEAPKHIANAIDATREELATMRAAVERCAELEAALVMVRRAYEIGCGGTYGSDGSPYALAREIEKSGLLSDTPTEGETE